MNLKRLSLLTAVALAVVGYAAVSASADILSPGEFGSPYQGAVKGVRSGAAPTFVYGSTTITCQTANIDGSIDGNAPATGTLNFSWASCTTQGAVPCSFSNMTGVDVKITEGNAPSATITNTETAGWTMTCGLTYTCNWSTNPASTPVTAEFDQASQVATIADTVFMTGSVGCSASGTGTWNAQYLITDSNNNDLDLWATG
jgi:hypothetical protein